MVALTIDGIDLFNQVRIVYKTILIGVSSYTKFIPIIKYKHICIYENSCRFIFILIDDHHGDIFAHMLYAFHCIVKSSKGNQDPNKGL